MINLKEHQDPGIKIEMDLKLEGAGMVVLEELEHAKKGRLKYAEVIGYGLSGDAYHPTAPAKDGNGGFRAMRMSLSKRKINAQDIDYINAHGTSTPLGDEIEFNSVKNLFSNNTKDLLDVIYKVFNRSPSRCIWSYRLSFLSYQ